MRSDTIILLINFYRDNNGPVIDSLDEFEAEFLQAVKYYSDELEEMLIGYSEETKNKERLKDAKRWQNKFDKKYVLVSKIYKHLINFYVEQQFDFIELVDYTLNDSFTDSQKERVMDFYNKFFVFNIRDADLANIDFNQKREMLLINLSVLLLSAGIDIFENYLNDLNGYSSPKDLVIEKVGIAIPEKTEPKDDDQIAFDRDVAIGEASEHRFICRINELLGSHISKIEQSIGYQKEFDCRITFQLKEILIPIYFECKSHPAQVFTQNVYLEQSCNKKKSGVFTSSDIMIHESFEIDGICISSKMVVVNTKSIPFCQQIGEARLNSGDGGRVIGFILNEPLYIDFFKASYLINPHAEGLRHTLLNNKHLHKIYDIRKKNDLIAKLNLCLE